MKFDRSIEVLDRAKAQAKRDLAKMKGRRGEEHAMIEYEIRELTEAAELLFRAGLSA
jgi:hypothetical protein